MSKSSIEWTDETWNPVTGCNKVSPGCKHCYAEREWPRLSHNPNLPIYHGRKFTDVQCHPARLDDPLHWTKPRMVFVNSMSDLFHEAVPFTFIFDVFTTMAKCPQHTFQILTKRAERMRDFMNWWLQKQDGVESPRGTVKPLANVWLGVSVENQEYADERIPFILQTPAAIRFVSYEPALGSVDFRSIDAGENARIDALRGAYHCDGRNEPSECPKLDWIIAGGESGPKARPSHPQWFRDVRDQCVKAGVAFFFKQNGNWVSVSEVAGAGEHYHFPDGATVRKAGKYAAGRTLDGRTWDEYPKKVVAATV